MCSRGFLGGLVLGSVLGAALAALNTPYNGDEVRRSLERTYQKGVDEARGVRHRMEHSVDDLRSSTSTRWDKTIASIRAHVSQLARQIDDLSSRGAKVLVEDEIL